MTKYLDLSPYAYIEDFESDNVLNIGWLDNSCQFNTESPIERILMILWEFCLVSIVQTRGLHECDLCQSASTIVEERNGVSLTLGSAEIRVFGENDVVYAAPNLIYHYVKEHNYRPPEEFINALLNGPQPPSEEYFSRLRDLRIDWNETLKGSGSGERFSF